jgi:hypothetical protein
MPAYKSMLVSHRLVIAGRLRSCHHVRKHKIVKGEMCIEVRVGMAWKGYCLACAAAMISEAEERLAELRSQAIPSRVA